MTVRLKSKTDKEDLEYYVYALIDPRYHEIFYIGRGQKNRINAHEYYADKIEKEDKDKLNKKEKLKRIKEIEKDGKKVEKYIIAGGLKEDVSKLIEASYIQLYKLKYQFNLTNIIKGCAKNYICWAPFDEHLPEQLEKMLLQRKIAKIKKNFKKKQTTKKIK